MRNFYAFLALASFFSNPVHAHWADSKDFIAYCEEGSSQDSADGVKYTIRRLLWSVRSEDCKHAFEKLQGLTSLNLNSNPEGGHQISDLRPLAGLKNLRHLDISNNKLKDLRPLASLENLSSLSLRGNRHELDLFPLRSLVNLQSLDLCWLGNRSLKPIQNLKNLEILGVSGSGNLDLISQLNLSKLEISNGHLNPRFLRPIKTMNSLKELKVWVGRSRSKPANIESLASLINLESLEFRDAWKLQDISIVQQMKKLRTFTAPFSSINDLNPLAELADLQTLKLRVNKVPANKDFCPTERGPEVLRLYCKALIGRS
ncbi:MAG: leucine-rich repeat domain-containing protein [Oligoflexales bacterium]